MWQSDSEDYVDRIQQEDVPRRLIDLLDYVRDGGAVAVMRDGAVVAGVVSPRDVAYLTQGNPAYYTAPRVEMDKLGAAVALVVEAAVAGHPTVVMEGAETVGAFVSAAAYEAAEDHVDDLIAQAIDGRRSGGGPVMSHQEMLAMLGLEDRVGG